MKLYVFSHPDPPAWGGGMIYAIADDETEARRQAENAVIAAYGNPWEGRRLGNTYVIGKPERVIEGPYAEAYEWSE